MRHHTTHPLTPLAWGRAYDSNLYAPKFSQSIKKQLEHVYTFDVKQNKSSCTQAAQIFINKYLDAKKRKFGEKTNNKHMIQLLSYATRSLEA